MFSFVNVFQVIGWEGCVFSTSVGRSSSHDL